jgi:hypothetical protein
MLISPGSAALLFLQFEVVPLCCDAFTFAAPVITLLCNRRERRGRSSDSEKPTPIDLPCDPVLPYVRLFGFVWPLHCFEYRLFVLRVVYNSYKSHSIIL